jgi:hypothetical protein
MHKQNVKELERSGVLWMRRVRRQGCSSRRDSSHVELGVLGAVQSSVAAEVIRPGHGRVSPGQPLVRSGGVGDGISTRYGPGCGGRRRWTRGR